MYGGVVMLMLLAALAFGNSNVDVVTIPSGSFVMGCNDPNPSYVPRSSGVPTIEQLQKQKRDEAFMKECLEQECILLILDLEEFLKIFLLVY